LLAIDFDETITQFDTTGIIADLAGRHRFDHIFASILVISIAKTQNLSNRYGIDTHKIITINGRYLLRKE